MCLSKLIGVNKTFLSGKVKNCAKFLKSDFSMDIVEKAKKDAAYKAVDNHVKDNSVVGVGSGSTVVYAVERLDSSSRSRRQKQDKSGRSEALEKLRNLKGGGKKNKYEVKEEEDVYEMVGEKEYSRLVLERQDDDWIVDDDGSGYVEDGREIFDDDIDEMKEVATKSKKTSSKRFEPPSKRIGSSSKGSDIKSLFAAAPKKKKQEQEIKLDEDALLGDILNNIHNQPGTKAPLPVLKPKQVSTSQFKKTPYKPPPAPRPRIINYENTPPPVLAQAKMASFPKPAEEKPKPQPHLNGEKENSKRISEIQVEQAELPSFSQTLLQSQDLFESQCLDEMQLDFSEEFTEEIAEVSLEKPSNQQELEEPEWKDAEWSGPSQLPTAPEITIDSSTLPLDTNSQGDSVFRFFWLDAYEDHLKHPGVIYLFGKVWLKEAKSYVSCCVIMRNVERKVFLLPRIKRYNLKAKIEMDQEVTMKDVYLEFNDKVATRFNISEFRSKPCKMSYVFGKQRVPKHSDYLLVRYSATYPALPADLEGETFSHVFGTSTTGLELLLLESRMRGPCWLDVQYPQPSTPPLSWCKIEVAASRLDSISVVTNVDLPLPPLVVMALNFQACPTSNPLQQEIVAASCLIHNEFPLNKTPSNPPYQNHFCALSKPSNCIFPFDFSSRLADYKGTLIKQTSSERNLLNLLAAQISRHDPDLIVGHDIVGCDLELLLQRIVHHKVPQWSKLGRLRRTAMLRPGHRDGRLLTCGRLVCDVKISAQELIRSRSYDLNELTVQVLNQHHLPMIDSHDISSLYSSSNGILNLVNAGMTQAEAALRVAVELNALPLALQITSLAGNLLSRTFLGGRSERNEYLLLHAFHEKNFICPDKIFGKNKQAALEDEQGDGAVVTGKKSSRRKPAYTGGLVLEPKKGFYDRYILLMDFNSLYPSIIQEYNICFTTLDLAAASTQQSEDADILPDRDAETGILPAEIRKLVESRRQVKSLMKNADLPADLRMQYDIRQKALKLTANSMYGCLGFSNSRFYAKALASLITSKGREILFKTKELVERLGLEVIYGDTDSIMINTNSINLDEVLKLGQNVKNEVNLSYRELEIDIDGIYKSMLLLKKKKYAALAITRKPDGQIVTSQETKGLDIVRRDWSELAKKCGEFVLKELLSGQPKEDFIQNIHSHLAELKDKVLNDELPIEDFLILKQLTKAPEDYPDKKNLPHVQVALRLNSKGGRRLRQGDIVKYVICEDGSNLAATQRAYHPDELKNNTSLKLDTKYYLSQQVHPVVSRLCDPIDGTDAATIAEFLGLDPSGYKHRTTSPDDAEDSSLLGMAKNDETRFADCEKPKVSCPECGKVITVEAPLQIKDDNSLEIPLDRCPQCNCALVAKSTQISNQIFLSIRHHIDRYYKSWLACEDPGCAYRTRRLPLHFTLQGPICPQCTKAVLHREYSEDQLYQQLSFYKFLFDLNATLGKMAPTKSNIANSQISAPLRNLYSSICQQADHWLARSAYRLVHLGNLFSLVHH